MADPTHDARRPWILLAAYDVSTGGTSEGYVAFNILKELRESHRIVLLTRVNNKAALEADDAFAQLCKGVRIVGFDLPRWARWWKRGNRFYQLYAYLWQLLWPLAVLRRRRMLEAVALVHVLNFHNDSMPSLAWMLRKPLVWGPINHHELAAAWRRRFWPWRASLRHVVAFRLRQAAWLLDPFLKLMVRRSTIVAAGPWVAKRLHLGARPDLVFRSQLGVDETEFGRELVAHQGDGHRTLVCAGRLDWMKGVDLAIEAMAQLPDEFRLLIIGSGPAKERLKALTAHLGLTDRIAFRQAVARSELAKIYSSADAFLFPSYEVAGLVWIEALASGLPVAAFDADTEVACAGRELPGIHLAAIGATREECIRNYAATVRAIEHAPVAGEAIRRAAVDKYKWAALVQTLRQAYSQAMQVSS